MDDDFRQPTLPTLPILLPPSAPPRIDAVLFGPGLQQGFTHAARINHALDLVEPHLGGPAYIRDVGGRFLATCSPHDRLLFDHGHPRALEPRYSWTDGPDGLQFGALVEGV